MKVIIHKEDNIENFYLVASDGELLGHECFAADAVTDTMNDEIAMDERLELAKRRLVQNLIYDLKAFYDDSKECKEFIIELKKRQINKDFKDANK